ncbi:MAG TPA: hypothetical protein VEK15_08925 [Vicinamibacteria bacterium]|nr:hypothetical protein [Vicinamibacteria bacterium]
MKILALITEHEIIRRILDHRDKNTQPRAPERPAAQVPRELAVRHGSHRDHQ